MRREWSQFWFAMGLIAITAALIANITHDDVIDLGPLSAWLAALATLAAVTVALFNTDRTIRDAVRRELESDQRATERFKQAILALAFRLKTFLNVYWKDDQENEISAAELDFLENRLRLDELIGLTSRMPLHQAPDTRLIIEVELLLFAAHTTAHEINECRQKISKSSKVACKIDLEAQLKICEEIEERLSLP